MDLFQTILERSMAVILSSDATRFISRSSIDAEDVCPITYNPIRDLVNEHRAVIAPCHHTFEDKAINEWLDKKPECPSCLRPLRKEDLRPLEFKTDAVAHTHLVPSKEEALVLPDPLFEAPEYVAPHPYYAPLPLDLDRHIEPLPALYGAGPDLYRYSPPASLFADPHPIKKPYHLDLALPSLKHPSEKTAKKAAKKIAHAVKRDVRERGELPTISLDHKKLKIGSVRSEKEFQHKLKKALTNQIIEKAQVKKKKHH